MLTAPNSQEVASGWYHFDTNLWNIVFRTGTQRRQIQDCTLIFDSITPFPIFVVALSVLLAVRANGEVSVRQLGGEMKIASDGIPDHAPGQFPNGGNPNNIRAQDYDFRISNTPIVADEITPLDGYLFGVAMNGVPFDPGTAEYWKNQRSSGWRYEAMSGAVYLGLDAYNAHVQPNGAYHYHGIPAGSTGDVAPMSHSMLIGYAADGFPIYARFGLADPGDHSSGIKELATSYRLRQGVRSNGPGNAFDGRFVEDYEFVEAIGDLDECNGRQSVTPEYPDGVYAYFLTTEFPFIPRCFRGAPDRSFALRRGGPFGIGRPPLGPPPRFGAPPSYRYVADALGVSLTEVRDALGGPPPRVGAGAEVLGVSRDRLIELFDEAFETNGAPSR
jgi:hypothetical protein